MKLKWLDRSLLLTPYYTLCTSEKILQTELKRMKVSDKAIGLNNGSGATTSFLFNNRDDRVAIVCLYDHSLDKEQIYSLLAHEAVHIFQEVLSIMNEDKPSCEFQAWGIQKISQELFYEYERQTKKKRKHRQIIKPTTKR